MQNTTKYFNLGVDDFRLASMPSGQCHVRIFRDEHDNIDEIGLISYSTWVCTLKRDIAGRYSLWCTGTYTSTTRRHINRFTTEFCGGNMYRECRDAVGGDRGYKIDLGYYVCLVNGFCVENCANWYIENGKPYFGHY